ncbi:MAG TPA: Gfo/Idh/MocA family oxidoreductase [Dongiaceae bacterium]|nr:Gfo/Idh/MocA family oxidoreductase [Dongiaceae bacterium]
MTTPRRSRSGPLRVALTGAGMISWHHLLAWRNLGPRVQLVSVCDPNRQNAQRRADEFGIPRIYQDTAAMLEDAEIDALDVASPRQTHATHVEAAAAKGIDVLCQKPLTPTLGEAEALIRRIAGKNRLMVHENWRFRPWYRDLHQWITQGELGDILMGQLAMIGSGMLPNSEGRRPALERQPFMASEAQLMIAEVLIHHLDVMRYLCGPLHVLAARTAHTLADVKGETLATILLRSERDAPLTVTGTMGAPGYPARVADRLELVGTIASATLQGGELNLIGPRPRSERYDLDAGYQASFDNTIAHFVDCLESGSDFETDALDNIETLKLVAQAYRAAAS